MSLPKPVYSKQIIDYAIDCALIMSIDFDKDSIDERIKPTHQLQTLGPCDHPDGPIVFQIVAENQLGKINYQERNRWRWFGFACVASHCWTIPHLYQKMAQSIMLNSSYMSKQYMQLMRSCPKLSTIPTHEDNSENVIMVYLSCTHSMTIPEEIPNLVNSTSWFY